MVKNISKTDLKTKIISEIDTFDDERLCQFYDVLLNFIDESELSKEKHQGLLDALNECKTFEGFDNDSIINQYKFKYAYFPVSSSPFRG